MPIATLIASLFSPAADLIKKFISKEEDQTKALAQLETVQSKVVETVISLEKQRLDLIKAETASTSWITQSWRPLASLAVIGFILVASGISFFKTGVLDKNFWDLANILLGVYAGGRSGEKIVGAISDAIKKK